MALKYYNPTSEGRRQLVTTDRSELWKGKPVKTLTEGLSKSGGRNNRGRITTQNVKVVKTDVERGLIMIQGSVPGAKGAWIMIKDAVKKPAPQGAAFPGSFKAAAEVAGEGN